MATQSKDFGINIGNIINQAVDMLIEAKLNKANFDATYEAVVIEVPSQSNGLYKVKIQNAIVEAASTGGTYYKGETVYVNVPRNDPNQLKFIIGRKPKAGDTQNLKAFDFKYPFDYFVPLRDLLSSLESQQRSIYKEEGGYLANYPEHGEKSKIPQPTASNQNCIFYWNWNGNTQNDLRSIGDTIGVQADWTTYLGEYLPLAGDYGLRFIVNGLIINGEEKEVDTTENYYFNTREMYGNPYAFYAPETQLILFDLSKFKFIKSIEAYFWQDHKFTDINGLSIPYTNSLNSEENPDNNDGLMPSNIFFSNLKILYGMHVDTIKSENVFLTTYDSRIFGTEPLSSKNRLGQNGLDHRTMHVNWVHKNEKVSREDKDTYSVVHDLNSFDIFNRDQNNKAHIYWYREIHSSEEKSATEESILDTLIDIYIKLLKLKILDLTLTLIDEIETEVATIASYAGANYRYMPQFNDLIDIEVDLKIELARESYVAVIEYNNNYGASEPLVFYNENREVENDLNAALNGIILKFFRPVNKHDATTGRVRVKTDENGAPLLDAAHNPIPVLSLIEDDSIGNFFVYDENNHVLKNDDNIKFSDVTYYVQVWIYSEELEDYIPLTNDICKDKDVDSIPGNGDIIWSYPTYNTMIAYFDRVTANEFEQYEGFDNIGTTSVANTLAITRKFRIRDFWDLRASDNAIMVTIKRNGRQYSYSKSFLFGQAGSSGSKYTIVVNYENLIGDPPVSNKTDFAIHSRFDDDQNSNSYFQITAKLYDLAGNLFTDTDGAIFNFTLLNSNVCSVEECRMTSIPTNLVNNTLIGKLYSKFPPIYRITCDINKKNIINNNDGDTGSYIISTIVGCSSVIGMPDTKQVNGIGYVGCPDRIEYKSDGTTPIYNQGDFIVRDHDTGDAGEEGLVTYGNYFYPEWSIVQILNDVFVDPNATNKQLKEITDASEIKYVKLNKQKHTLQDINSNIEDSVIQETVYKDSTTTYYTYNSDKIYYTYSLGIKTTDSQKSVYWEEAMVYDSSTYLVCQLPENGGTFYQAIAFARNTYPSSLINSWNGLLLIDKEKNAILSRMISAGVKDSVNMFSGVILGDWSEYGDASIDPIGLYGFAHGIQTFGFKADGTGFIGAAGAGLITFDGNHALISDHTGDHYINLNPLKYTYDRNNHSININSGTYSQYFLYAKNQKLTEANSGGITNIYRDEYGRIYVPWIKKFQDDTDSDYFVVDPNNGVYMSGGIVARYGVIGNCLQLSEAGLTYKKNNGIMFIGQERSRNAKLVPEDSNVNYDTYFWASAKYKKGNWNNSEFDYIDSENGVSGDQVGRYIFWAGSTNDNGIPLSYPNFGIEHNGVVHLTGAYISGAIKATSLEILMPDGTYHPSKEKLHATYYASINPARLTTEGGICSHNYGDLLIDGDIWYDTSTSVDLKSVTAYSVAYTNGTGFPTEAPSSHSNNGNAANALTSSSTVIDPTATTGYKVLTWKKPSEDIEDADINADWYEDKGVMQPPTGWTLLPALAADTLTFMNTYTGNLEKSLVSILSALVDSINKSYNSIRRGMTPLAFYSGKCFTSLSASTVMAPSELNIGTVPPGLAIYQLDDDYVYTGSSFLLNGERMGFFKHFKDENVTLPLLAYYGGNMALAGNLLFGLDVTAATNTSGFNKDQPNYYQNVLEGLTCTLSLGNGAIVLNGGHTAGGNGTTAATGIPYLKVGKDVGAKVLIGAESTDNVDVLIGAFDNADAKISLAGFDIKGVTTSNIGYGISGLGKINDIDDKQEYMLYTATAITNDSVDDTWTVSSGNIRLSYKWSYITAHTAEKLTSNTVENLNTFSITNNGRGINIYEKNNIAIFAPTAACSYLTNWSYINSDTLAVKQEIYCAGNIIADSLYSYEGIGETGKPWVSKVASLTWVLDTLVPTISNIETSLNAMITNLKKTKAPYNHSHS